MDLNLRGKTVLVTGGSRGIGFAAAKQFLAEGALPTIVGRDIESLKSAAKELNNCPYYACDLSDQNQSELLVNKIGPVDILVNCAGGAITMPAESVHLEDWHNGLSKKLWAYLNVINPMIKHMARSQQGVVVNVIGIGGKVFSDNHLIGGSANAALMMATAGYAKEYASKNIRVVGVNPAGVETTRLHNMISQHAQHQGLTYEQVRQNMLKQYPQQEFVRLDTVANTIVFLASDCAYSINGTTIQVDGSRSPMI